MWNPIAAIRQNHALEHATIAILARHPELEGIRIAGRASLNGFYIYGDIPTKTITETVGEALERLKKGESELAISPFCGTNLAVAGALAGIAALIALGKKNRMERLPRVIMASTLAIVAARPIGVMVQKHLTTSVENVEHLHINHITHMGWGKLTWHKVETIIGGISDTD
jgi:fructose-1,6-bisphosphatase/sedoheptulose 1,7-bisphosphatase-like protein